MLAVILYVTGGAAREVCVQRRCRGLLLRTGASGSSTAQHSHCVYPAHSQFLLLLPWGFDTLNPTWGCFCDVVASGSSVL